MLKISDLQLESMKGVLVEAFHERLFRFARNDLAEYTAGLDDAALRARIREDVEAAQSFGITSNRVVAKFVGFSLVSSIRERFYQRAEFITLLGQPDSGVWLEDFLRHLQNHFEQLAVEQKGAGTWRY